MSRGTVTAEDIFFGLLRIGFWIGCTLVAGAAIIWASRVILSIF